MCCWCWQLVIYLMMLKVITNAAERALHIALGHVPVRLTRHHSNNNSNHYLTWVCHCDPLCVTWPPGVGRYTHKLPANQLLSFRLCLSRCLSALLPSISSPHYMRADCPRSGRKKSLNISRTSCALIDICSNTHKSVPARATKWIWNECAGEGAGTVSAKCSHTSKASLCAKIFSQFEQIYCPSVRTWEISANKAFAICKRHTN